ncbi:2-oxo-tetronate isomerase [Propionivibrio sp.]|uniref:2-oxo-tetronate isomerase n=1 Tax=Propionivibrio sp. TaxID=2212460 RepID=UPI0025FA7965|nr:2-oxo-tetronate isomerase [Propionivibrio sp.]MBK7356934.1 hydroxypyruvate isomerase [Propionivibrio sp.]MBK8401635.1 hydroxypyruvate isomerase [Propionivibrio sp.]MBK8745203.1 hydroxypyruvate isomerase [Propionivibrio sp.]MBK8893950.1 hydroxypyruvate isomerase [Propionivibrio sp.]MBL0208143.1 hydroxypyruvate isomerase [Propionivibrio sp.]
MPRFAANLTMMFTELPFTERFAAAARAGFAAVEFLFPYDYPVADVTSWLNDAGLKSALFNMPPGDWAAGERGIASIPGREGEFRAGVAKALKYASAMGTPRIHAMAGLLPAGADRASHRAVFVDNLRYAAGVFSERGLTLLIEPINMRDMPGYFLNTQAEAHALCAEIGAPNLKVQMDIYHAQIVEGDLSMTLKNNIAGIGHIQIASVPGRHEPDEGEVDYRHLFRLLDDLGYQGWVGCEYRPRGRTEDGLGWLKKMT